MNIKTVQLNLIKLGYGSLLRPYGADGKNGTKTRGAVRAFQKDYNKLFNKNILVDGIPGPQTYEALRDWIKNAGIKGTKNFNINEFASKDGGGLPKSGMNKDLITKLEQLRYNLGDKAIVINSGYRTASHNRAVGGASGSQHLYGKAADIVVRGVSASKVYSTADKMFNGVGKYNTFTHVDTRATKARF